MRTPKTKSLLLSVAVALTLIWSASAQEGESTGHGGGNGGDPVIARMRLIRSFTHMNVRQEILAYLQNAKRQDFSDPSVWEALKDMRERGLIDDVQESAYTFRRTCKEVGGLQGGGSINGDIGGDICLSPMRLAEIDATKKEIIALLVHEHAHHFGYEDLNHSIYKGVLATLRISKPGWTDGLPPPSSPVSGGRHSIKSSYSGMCLTFTDQGPGSLVYQYACKNTLAEDWKIERTSPGSRAFRIVSRSTDLCMQINSATDLVELWRCNGESNQQFNFFKIGKRYSIQRKESGKCVSLSDASFSLELLQEKACDYGLSQLFDIPALDPR